MRKRVKLFLLSAAITCTVISSIILLVFLLNKVSLFEKPSTIEKSRYVAQTLTVFGSVFSVHLFGSMVYVILKDRSDGYKIDQLYWSSLGINTAIMIVLVIVGIGSLDRVSHHLQMEWNLTNDPDVSWLTTVSFFGLVVCQAWFHITLLQGRGLKQVGTVNYIGTMILSGIAVLGAATVLA